MKPRHHESTNGLFLAALCLCALSVAAQDAAVRIPESKIRSLEAELANKGKGASALRRRRACKNMIRDAEALLEAFPAAPNRYRILGITLKTRKELFSLDKTERNREAIFETCRQLADAPDVYAGIRLDADLLLLERELAQKRASPEARAEAYKALVAHYFNTPAEAESIKVASLMAFKLGDANLLNDFRRVMSEHYAGDPNMIEFQLTKLDNHILGVPFHGTFKRADGTVFSFPMDCMGQFVLLYFWSQEENLLEEHAAEWKALQAEYLDQFEIFSFNLDDLPDAGEKRLRTLGLDWHAMRLPDGKDSQTYRNYARRDPILMRMSPSGYVVLLPHLQGGSRPGHHLSYYASRLGSRLQGNVRYRRQLQSLCMGEFLVVHPYAPFDAASPPEVTRIEGDGSEKDAGIRGSRTAASVPEQDLRAVQVCFAPPPLRYRLPRKEAWANYEKAEALCRKAIERYPQAPNLWIVYNRRIIALLGMWKLASEPKYLERAVQEAKVSLALKLPPGAQIVPQFCLAKEALRQEDADPESALDAFIEAAGGGPRSNNLPACRRARGSALAAASILALDACSPYLHARYRKTVLDDHAEDPMVWTVLSSLLDRFHRYYLFRAPYNYGHISTRRKERSLFQAEPGEMSRLLKADFKTLDGSTFSIPRDTAGKWAVILFMTPWEKGARSTHEGMLRQVSRIVKGRAAEDINVIAAFCRDDTNSVSALMSENPWGCRTVVVPDGLRNPMVHRLGILAEDLHPNVVLLRPDGVIAASLSGLVMGIRGSGNAISYIIEWHDEKAVDNALKSGEFQEAIRLACKVAPPDQRRSNISLTHLRSRAKAYMALKDWEAAVADMDEFILRQKQSDAKAAIRSPEIVEALRLRATIRDGLGQSERAREDRQLAATWARTVTDE